MQNLSPDVLLQAQNVLLAAQTHCGDVLGAYIHGSVSLGGYVPGRSDLDLLIVCKEPMSRQQRLDFAAALLALHNNPCPIELSVLAQDGLMQAPPACTFHFSSMWAPRYSDFLRTPALSAAHQSKMQAFYQAAALLFERFSIVPLLYGSLGLECAAHTDLHADDLDVLIPKVFLTDAWPQFRQVLENSGYELIDEREHTFVKAGLQLSFAQLEELQTFADIPLDEIAVHHCNSISYQLLSLPQYLQVYTASSRDGYRIQVRGKKDAEKIALLHTHLQLAPLLDSTFPDNDIPPYFRVARDCGICLYGKEPASLLPAVSDVDIYSAITEGIADFSFDDYGQFASNILTLPRILSFACTRKILTKVQAAHWAAELYPQYADLLLRAETEYLTGAEQPFSFAELEAYRNFMIALILKGLR